MKFAHGEVEQAILRLLSDGTPRTARQIIDTLCKDRRTVHRALLILRGQQFRHPALIALHAKPPAVPTNVWTITGTGRLTIQREVTD